MIKHLAKVGVKAIKTSNSGASFTITKNKEIADAYRGDLLCNLDGWQFNAEVKGRADDSGWKCVKEWLGNADMLFIIEDFKKPLAVIPWHIFELLMSKTTPKPFDGIELSDLEI
jgi:hypothetical protein